MRGWRRSWWRNEFADVDGNVLLHLFDLNGETIAGTREVSDMES
jgi:hypothetical protein